MEEKLLELIDEFGLRGGAVGRGQVLMTGSIAGFQPGSFQAVYNGTKAFIDSFAAALRNELKDPDADMTDAVQKRASVMLSLGHIAVGSRPRSLGDKPLEPSEDA